MPFLTGTRRTWVKIASVVILLVTVWLDYITGYEFGFFIFYFVPVSIAAWYGGRKPGLAMACASAVCWYFADRMTHHPYSRPSLIYWETFMRLLSFLTTALTLTQIRETVDNVQRLRVERDRALEENRELRRQMQGNVGNAGIQDRPTSDADPP
jgi:hypothetical protein